MVAGYLEGGGRGYNKWGAKYINLEIMSIQGQLKLGFMRSNEIGLMLLISMIEM